jgi:4-hydroxybenzoate polyprenyltransferase
MSAVGFLSLLIYSGTMNGHGFPFYVGVAVAGVLLLHALFTTDINRPEDCKRLFLGTPRVGQVILLGFVVDAVFQRIEKEIPL